LTGDAAADFQPLRTERLTLRPLRPEDAAELHRLVNDWEVAKTLARVPFPYPRPLADEWIASTHAQMQAGTAWHLAITGLEQAGEPGEREVLVGCIGLTGNAAKREAELGYWIGRRFWGHGVGPEAASRLASWALANLELDRLVASALAENTRSQALLRRIGFRETGEGVRDFLARGGTMPVKLFELTRAGAGGPARCGRCLRADRCRWPRAAGAAAGGQADGGPVGIPRRQAAARRNARGRADPRIEGGAGDRRRRQLPRPLRLCQPPAG
jgi:8-oxo-dGTP diphosphatase